MTDVVDIKSGGRKKKLREVLNGPPGDDWWPSGTPRDPDEFDVAWEDIARDAKGKPLATPLNIGLILHRSEDWELYYDEFAQLAIVAKVPDVGAAKPRLGEVDDYHLACVVNWLSINYGVECGKKTAMDGVVMAAKQNWRDPVKEYFRDLKWDGEARLHNWLSRYGGVQDEESQRLGLMWVVSAVARAIRPGCKADYMLVLIGDQGDRKTGVFETLCPQEDWFQPDLPDLRDKDAMQSLTGVLFVNADEMNAFKKADLEELAKNFLTRRFDRYRPPYGALFKTVKRRCVFCGTSNRREVLNDPTGGRRYWCAMIDSPIRLDDLARDRDQIWAEAYSYFMDGAQWWPEKDVEQRIMDRNRENYTVIDSWETTISAVCASSQERGVTVKELFRELGFDGEAKHTMSDTKRVTNVLISLGWEQKGMRCSGSKRERLWRKR